MPLKLNIGLSKKIGLPDYGSLGASCHVEVELDSSLLRGADLTAFHAHVRTVFVACGQAVDDELRRSRKVGASAAATHPVSNSPVHDASHGAAVSRPAPATASSSSNFNGRHASQKQLEYLGKLSQQVHGLGEQRLHEISSLMFSKPVTQLSGFEASALIDQLKAIKAGQIRLEDVLNGAPA